MATTFKALKLKPPEKMPEQFPPREAGVSSMAASVAKAQEQQTRWAGSTAKQ